MTCICRSQCGNNQDYKWPRSRYLSSRSRFCKQAQRPDLAEHRMWQVTTNRPTSNYGWSAILSSKPFGKYGHRKSWRASGLLLRITRPNNSNDRIPWTIFDQFDDHTKVLIDYWVCSVKHNIDLCFLLPSCQTHCPNDLPVRRLSLQVFESSVLLDHLDFAR